MGDKPGWRGLSDDAQHWTFWIGGSAAVVIGLITGAYVGYFGYYYEGLSPTVIIVEAIAGFAVSMWVVLGALVVGHNYIGFPKHHPFHQRPRIVTVEKIVEIEKIVEVEKIVEKERPSAAPSLAFSEPPQVKLEFIGGSDVSVTLRATKITGKTKYCIAGPFAHSCSEGGVTWNRLPLMRWHNNVRLAQYWNLRGLSEPEGPTKVCFYCPSGSVVLENYCEDRVWPEATVWRRDDLFKVNIGGLSQMKGLAFLIERSISDDASNHRNDGEEPVRPDRRIRTKPPGPLIFLFGAIAIGLGCLLAYRFEFIRQRPDVAFVLLVGYGGLVLLLCGLLGAWLSVALS